jgi:hypothetical protein
VLMMFENLRHVLDKAMRSLAFRYDRILRRISSGSLSMLADVSGNRFEFLEIFVNF